MVDTSMAQTTPLKDLTQKALTEMRAGYRLNLDSLLDAHSATYGTEVSVEIARRFDALSAEHDTLRSQLDAADAAWCERVSLLEKALDAKQAHDAQKLNDMVDDAVKNLARAWASMDGKPFDDNGYREGYIADAAELLDRSGIAAERGALRTQRDAAEAETLAAIKQALEGAAGAVANESSGHPEGAAGDEALHGAWNAIRALDPAQFVKGQDT